MHPEDLGRSSDLGGRSPARSGIKDRVRAFWDATPCGTRGLTAPEGSVDFFAELERQRDLREPFIKRFSRFGEWKGRSVIEIGVGAATDFVRFARAGARLTGVDLTPRAVSLARRRLALEGLDAEVQVSDAEALPFPSDSFDFAYSWGVIHHTEDTAAAAREIVRVTKPGGEICVMVYNRHSLVAIQCWIVNALLRGRPNLTLREVIWEHIESFGTKAFTTSEARVLFEGLENLRVTPVVTPYDVRITRSSYLPKAVQSLVPPSLGWFLVIEGRKRS